MAKHLKVNIKNTQIAKAINLSGLKKKLGKKKASSSAEELPAQTASSVQEEKKGARVRARSKSVFTQEPTPPQEEGREEPAGQEAVGPLAEQTEKRAPEQKIEPQAEPKETAEPPVKAEEEKKKPVKLGPTGRHVDDLLPPKSLKKEPVKKAETKSKKAEAKEAPSKQEKKPPPPPATKAKKAVGYREYSDFTSARKQTSQRAFDSRDRHGLRSGDEEYKHRKRRSHKTGARASQDLLTVRPSELTIRTPITLKDLASEMKLKASQLIGKLFSLGAVVTINDVLDDETTLQLLGEEFGCRIRIDTSEEERLRITDKSITEEIAEAGEEELMKRAPVVAFMGHVDHGKTSLIDKIRLSNIASGEAGAITQHIGAFKCSTKEGPITILDTPGHEAFSSMRARGANVTDIVVLVVAGDEGIRQQTIEAIEHARSAGVAIVVAINKCDKPNFDADQVYRQLAEQELLPEAWGGQTITVNCSALTGEGLDALLQMLALQSEILETRANPLYRARGTVLESEMHKGLGAVATVLVQNGTLHKGDALVIDVYSGKVKTMHDEHGNLLEKAGPSTPVEITGLSGLPDAGQEFIVVKSEQEAKKIADARRTQIQQKFLKQKKSAGLEALMEKAAKVEARKIFNVVLCADVQGSLEAMATALKKIKSEKIQLEIVATNVGEISESDIELAATSNAILVGFHTKVEAHAESLLKNSPVRVLLHDVIYHAVDEVKSLMRESLDRVPEIEEKGKAQVKAIFKSSQLGNIAGCIVTEGSIHRNHQIRVVRGGETVWEGSIASLKRVQEDVREVQKGLECGIVLKSFKEIEEGDELQTFTVHYIMQDL